ncbi:Transcription factor HEX [Handroanthus impetiginosus]|uniref:Transcription factor HEX n=1 Tax=Handroanthus impetiginosus TaxID=429701 RepID=A0A2G9HFF8_9LAMI|nr:Transcription factor HEX [Handroanthus impetiginosus]
MENFPNSNSSCLELTIAMPGGFSSSPSLLSSGESGGNIMKEVPDINQIPSPGLTEEECMEEEDESPMNGGPAPRKKLRLTKEQSRLLEESFRQNHTLNPKQKETLAEQLNLKPRQVEVWYQNRRARSKLKQTEMECEYLKRWFGSLTEQNRKLQKEVEELRAMKVGQPHGGHHLPPTSTLTMCPRCQRVTTTAPYDKGPTTTTAAITTTTNAATKMPFIRSRQSSAACYK